MIIMNIRSPISRRLGIHSAILTDFSLWSPPKTLVFVADLMYFVSCGCISLTASSQKAKIIMYYATRRSLRPSRNGTSRTILLRQAHLGTCLQNTHSLLTSSKSPFIQVPLPSPHRPLSSSPASFERSRPACYLTSLQPPVSYRLIRIRRNIVISDIVIRIM